MTEEEEKEIFEFLGENSKWLTRKRELDYKFF